MKAFVVRHGETEWSARGRHTSVTDLPLTEAGRRRATAVGEELASRSFSLVLCSPLRRARETCELAGFGDAAVLCEDLHEWEYGDFEGLTTAQIHDLDPSWSLWRDGCPSGERPDQVAVRVDRVLERLTGGGETGGGEAVGGGAAGGVMVGGKAAGGEALAFAHGHVLRVLAARWIGMGPAAGARFALDAGAIGVLGHEHGTQVIERWNYSPGD